MAVVVTVAKGYDLGYIWKTQTEQHAGRTTGGYYINAAQAGEPPGRWWGPGAQALGLSPGQIVQHTSYDAVYRQLDPRTGARLGRPRGRYPTFADHLARLTATEPHAVILVMHDWGSALGFSWAQRHPGRVKALIYMESIVRPFASWDEWPEATRAFFQAQRTPAGEDLILQKNLFIEYLLRLRGIGAEAMEVYRRHYRNPGPSRQPMLSWARDLPIAGEPADVVKVVDSYGRWLAQCPIPKLFIDAEPAGFLIGAQREFCRAWPNQQTVTVNGAHFLPEDAPAEIGVAMARFVAAVLAGQIA